MHLSNTESATTRPVLTPVEVEQAVSRKGTRFATVTFIKKSGEERKLNGLFRPTSKILGTGRPTAPHLVAIWSPREGWRSFDKSRVVSVK
jgi:hypothetical protein